MLRVFIAMALAAVSIAGSNGATASEVLRVAIPNRGSWDTSYTELGLQQGFFREYGLELELTFTENSGASQKALTAGATDISVATSFLDVLVAYAQGAPVRIVSAELTGAPDLFWYAKIAGATASFQDLHGKAVSYSRPGSSSNIVLLQLLNEARVNDARLIPIGSASNGYTDILNAQLDASWASPPTVINELLSGEIRVIARGNDSLEVRNKTRRVNAVSSAFLAGHRNLIVAFLKAYKKSVDWAFSGEPPLRAYAKYADVSVDAARIIAKEFSSVSANQMANIEGEDRVLEDALTTKRIAHPLTHDDVKGVYDLVNPDDR